MFSFLNDTDFKTNGEEYIYIYILENHSIKINFRD